MHWINPLVFKLIVRGDVASISNGTTSKVVEVGSVWSFDEVPASLVPTIIISVALHPIKAIAILVTFVSLKVNVIWPALYLLYLISLQNLYNNINTYHVI